MQDLPEIFPYTPAQTPAPNPIPMPHQGKAESLPEPDQDNLEVVEERDSGDHCPSHNEEISNNSADCAQPLMSTLLLYTHISSFSMIYPMSFRPFPTIFDDFRCFYGISDVCSLISYLLLHRWTIYAFPIL